MLRFIRKWLIKRARSCTKCSWYSSCPDADIAAYAFMYKSEVVRYQREKARNCFAYCPEVPEFNDSDSSGMGTVGDGTKDYFVLSHHKKNIGR